MHVHIYYDFIVSAALNLEFSEDKIFLYMSKQTGQNKSSLYRTNACVLLYMLPSSWNFLRINSFFTCLNKPNKMSSHKRS